MATYTENYQLHQWVPEDDFLRTDFNTDFQKLDEALAAVKALAEDGCAMLFWPLAFTMPNALRAAGDVRVPMAVSIVSMVTVRVGGSYLLGLHFGLGAIGVWIAMVADWVVRVLCFVLRARKKLWLEHP